MIYKDQCLFRILIITVTGHCDPGLACRIAVRGLNDSFVRKSTGKSASPMHSVNNSVNNGVTLDQGAGHGTAESRRKLRAHRSRLLSSPSVYLIPGTGNALSTGEFLWENGAHVSGLNAFLAFVLSFVCESTLAFLLPSRETAHGILFRERTDHSTEFFLLEPCANFTIARRLTNRRARSYNRD